MTTQVFIANPEGPDDIKVEIHGGGSKSIRILKPRECMAEYVYKGRTISISEVEKVEVKAEPEPETDPAE